MICLWFNAAETKNFPDVLRRRALQDHGIDYKPVNAKSGVFNQTK
jgi:hypothetical protein